MSSARAEIIDVDAEDAAPRPNNRVVGASNNSSNRAVPRAVQPRQDVVPEVINVDGDLSKLLPAAFVRVVQRAAQEHADMRARSNENNQWPEQLISKILMAWVVEERGMSQEDFCRALTASRNGVTKVGGLRLDKDAAVLKQKSLRNWLNNAKVQVDHAIAARRAGAAPVQIVYKHGKRGRPRTLEPEEEQWALQFFSACREESMSVEASLVAMTLAGVVAARRPQDLLAVEGTNRLYKFSRKMAIQFMRRNGITKRAATGDRTVRPSEVLGGGRDFFARIARHHDVTDPRRIINMDEFFVHLDAKSNNWTWTRLSVGARGNVQIRKANKLGFTLSVTSNAAGEILLIQVIWKGSTNQVHVPNSTTLHPKIFQQHREKSHFQNVDTFEEFAHEMVRRLECELQKLSPTMNQFVREAGPIRTAAKEKILLVLDAAPQHGADKKKKNKNAAAARDDENDDAGNGGAAGGDDDDDEKTSETERESRMAAIREYFANENVVIEFIPPQMTHVFQPADQLIIAVIKTMINQAWKAQLHKELTEEIRKSIEKADKGGVRHDIENVRAYFKTQLHLSLPTRRRDKMLYLSQALQTVTAEAVQKSWWMSGIIKAMPRLNWSRVCERGRDPASRYEAKNIIVYDHYKAMATLLQRVDATANIDNIVAAVLGEDFFMGDDAADAHGGAAAGDGEPPGDEIHDEDDDLIVAPNGAHMTGHELRDTMRNNGQDVQVLEHILGNGVAQVATTARATKRHAPPPRDDDVVEIMDDEAAQMTAHELAVLAKRRQAEQDEADKQRAQEAVRQRDEEAEKRRREAAIAERLRQVHEQRERELQEQRARARAQQQQTQQEQQQTQTQQQRGAAAAPASQQQGKRAAVPPPPSQRFVNGIPLAVAPPRASGARRPSNQQKAAEIAVGLGLGDIRYWCPVLAPARAAAPADDGAAPAEAAAAAAATTNAPFSDARAPSRREREDDS